MTDERKPLGRPRKRQAGMIPRQIYMTPEQWAFVERVGGNYNEGTRVVVSAVRLLTPEQWAWLNEYGTPAEVLAEAVQFRMDVERAEAEAEALAPTYNGQCW